MSSEGPLSVNGIVVIFLAGTAIYWLYFHRYETHLYGLLYLNTVLSFCFGLSMVLVKIYSYDVAATARVTTSVLIAFLLGIYSNLLLFRAYINPLNKIPGPWQARISSLWLSTQLGHSDGYYWLQKQHQKYGKWVRIGSNDISCIDPEILELAYGPRSKLTKADWYDKDEPRISLHTCRDKDLHDFRRRIWAPAFSERALRNYEVEIQKFNDKVVALLDEYSDKPVNITKWFKLYSFDVMGRLAFGKDYSMLEQGKVPHELEILGKSMQPLAYRLPAWAFRLVTQIPGLSAGYQRFIDFCIGELTWRIRTQTSTDAEGDIMSWILKAYQNDPSPERNALLQGDARLIIIAGSDTTAAALTYMFFHLAQHPEIVQKLREELAPLTQGSWKEMDIRSAKLLNGCINESLRMHPPVPSGLPRSTPSEGLNVGNVWIPGMTTIITPMFAMGRDPSLYIDPDSFVPERWYAETEKVKHKDAFAPFSMGPFKCIGQNLALLELRTLSTRLVQRFDMKLAQHEDGRRILEQTKDHFTVDLGDCEVVFISRV